MREDARTTLKMTTAPRTWREGLFCGNGQIAAVLYGNIASDRILVNDERFYFRSKTPDLPDISSGLAKLRQMMQEKDYIAANHLYEDRLRGEGYNPEIAIYQPGFDVLLQGLVQKPFQKYDRELDLRNGEARVNWSDGEVDFCKRMFVSVKRPLIAFRFSASARGRVNLEVGLDLHNRADAILENGELMDVPLSAQVDVSMGLMSLRGNYSGKDDQSFGGLVRVITHGGDCRRGKDGLIIQQADCVDLLITTAYGSCGDEDFALRSEMLLNLEGDYLDYFEEHKTICVKKFDEVTLDLGGGSNDRPTEVLLTEAFNGPLEPNLVEKLFYFGRYLLISSSTSGSLPAHLQGKWNGDYDPAWQCFFMANENIQMNYWQCLKGNLWPNLMPLFDYYESLLRDFRLNAKRLFGCRGILIPAATAPDSGFPKILHAQIIYWTGAAGWLAQHFYDYWRYSQDEQFLRKRALPFMREVALFYQDFLFTDADGKAVFFPSVSPENYPAEFFREWVEGGPVFISVNATMEIAICRELLTNLIYGAESAGMYSESIAEWQSLLNTLPEYRFDKNGTICEWHHPDFPNHDNHRHLSHLYPYFPGREFSPEDPLVCERISQILQSRLTAGLQSQTGWSLVHIANILAKFRNGDGALNSLHLLIKSCIGSNLVSYHNDDRGMGITLNEKWGRSPAFQIEANLGFPAAVMEMLLFSEGNQLTLLPALPSSWKRGSITGLRAENGVAVDVCWNQSEGYAEAKITGPCGLKLLVNWGEQALGEVEHYTVFLEDTAIDSADTVWVALTLTSEQPLRLRMVSNASEVMV